jgi:hypothetical protein
VRSARLAPDFPALQLVPSGREGRGPQTDYFKRINMSTTEPTSSKAPTHVAYQVRDREGHKGIWTRIGAAWPQKDGKGFNIQLDAIPLDGRVTLRIATDKQD